jgi:hypothetical protein
MTRLGYRFIYKHQVAVQRDAADVVTLLASGELKIAIWTRSRL